MGLQVFTFMFYVYSFIWSYVQKSGSDSGLDITVALSVTVGVIAGDPCLGAAPGIGLQSAEGAAILVIAAEAGVHQAQGVHLHNMMLHLQQNKGKLYLMCDLTSHVREVCPAVTSGITGLHVWDYKLGYSCSALSTHLLPIESVQSPLYSPIPPIPWAQNP